MYVDDSEGKTGVVFIENAWNVSLYQLVDCLNESW